MSIFEAYSAEPPQFNFSLSSKAVIRYDFKDDFIGARTSIYAPGYALSVE